MPGKRKLGWAALIILIAIVAIGITGYFVLRSRAFHQYLLTKIDQKASESTGGQVQINNFAFHIATLSADVYGITIRGSEPKSAQPLLQAEQLAIGLKIVSLLRHKIDLNEIIVRHPVVNLLVNKDGNTNLPHAPQTGTGSTNVFDLGIQHVLLSHGEVYYNDVKTPLDAELHDLQLELRSAVISKQYDGSLSYRDGRLQYGSYKPLPHNLNASFTANPTQLNLKPLVLTVASSTIQLDGQVENYSRPSADGRYQITIHPQDFRPLLNDPSIPTGEIMLAGSLRYQSEPHQPLLRAIVLDGQLGSRELAVNSPDLRTIIRNLRGQFHLANGNLDARGLGADLLGGRLVADMKIEHLDTSPTAKLHASLHSLSIMAARDALKTGNFNHIPLQGEVNGTADASWSGSIQNLKARSDITLTAALTSKTANPPSTVPIDGTIHLSYDKAPNLATFTNTFLRTPQTRIDLKGTAGQRLNLQVQARAADLRELEALATALESTTPQASANRTPAPPLNLAGSANTQISVQGRMNNPLIRSQLNARNLQLQNSQWRTVQLALEASKSGISVENASLVNARQGYVNFSLSAGLANWHYFPSAPLSAQLTARGLAIKQLLQVANLQYPVFGNLSADIYLRGSQLNPVGNGWAHLEQARVYGQQLQNLSLQFKGDGNAVNSTLKAHMPAGAATANLIFYPKTKGYQLRFNAPGIELANLEAVQDRNLQLSGVLSAAVSGQGTLENPQFNAVVEIPQLQVRQTNIAAIKAQFNVANRTAQLVVDSQMAKAFVQARANLDLTGNYYTRATLDTKAIPLEGLLALYTPVRSNAPQGEVELHASIDGPLKDPSRLQAQVIIPTLNVRYQALRIGNTRPIRIHYANSVVALDPSEIAGTDTNLRLQGQLPLRGNAPATLTAVGGIDMHLLRFFQPDVQSSGKLMIDVRAIRTGGSPILEGQLRIQDVSLITPDAPLGLQNVNGVLDIQNNQVRITQITGQAGGGQISLAGVVGYRPQIQMNVVLHAKSVRILYQDAARVVLDSDLNLVGTGDAANLSGRVLINNMGFLQPNSDITKIASQFSSSSSQTAPPATGFMQNLKLNVSVVSTPNLSLTSTAVNLQGQVNLRVIGTAADPVIVGRTELTGGEIFLMNKRYQIQHAIIQFSNPSRTDPVLKVLLTTTINQYNISLNLMGPIDKMQTTYISDPPLPTADIINLIARGQTTEQAPSTPSSFGASSLLAQGAASQVSSGIQKLAGLSSFEIDPTLGGNNTNPGARVALQKRVTKNFFFTFASDVTATQNQIVQGEYQLSKRWSVSATRNQYGGYAVDGKFHTTF